MSQHRSVSAPARPERTGGDPSPAVAGTVLLLIGGVIGLLQLLAPWFTTGDESITGWQQYYAVAHSGVADTVAAYAIVIAALAGAAMIWAALLLLTRRPRYRGAFTLATIAASVALACTAWFLAFGAAPGLASVTFGWYLFLLAGILGILGVGISSRVISLPAGLLLAAGAAGLGQLALPWLPTATRAGTGWQQYYETSHSGVVEVVGAYAVIVAAIASAVLLIVGVALAVTRRTEPGTGLARVGLAAGIVATACAAWWIATAGAGSTSTLGFGWYLFLLAGPLGALAALDATLREGLRAAPALLLIGGAAGVAQIALPWFDGRTAWGFYYGTAHTGYSSIVSAYAILLGLIAALVLLAGGIVMLARPALTVAIARTTRIAAIVMLACAVWWIILGPVAFAETIGGGGFGWYAFILAGLIGLTGASIPLAGAKLSFDKASFMVVFLGIPLLIFLVFVVSPFVQAIYYSMTDWGGFSADMNFIGFDNYTRLIHDDTFRQALINNVELGIVVPLVTLVLAIAVASMVTVGGPSRGPVRGLKASSFYRVVSFFPYTVPAIVIGLIWAQVYDPTNGILNGFLTSIGLERFTDFGWLGDITAALPASMFVIIWSFVGFYAVLFIAAIKGVSAEIYEAAKLDGAGRLRTAVSVTIPLIRDTIQTAYIYIGIAALDAFVYMAALNPTGGTLNSTLVMSQDLLDTAFKKGQFGYATSMGVVLAVVTLLFATLVFAVNRWTGGGPDKTTKKRRRDTSTITAVAAQPVSTLQVG